MATSIQVLWAIALVAITMWLTTVYWMRVIRKSGQSEKTAPKPQTAVHEQVKQNAYMEWKMQNEHMERMKDRAASQKQTQALKNKVEFMSDVLPITGRDVFNSLSISSSLISLKPKKKSLLTQYGSVLFMQSMIRHLLSSTSRHL